MYRGNASRIVPIILVLIIIAITIAALVSAGRAIFGGNQTSDTQPDIGHSALINTSADRSVRMTVRGPIVADENFRSYQVTLDSSSRVLTTYSGYIDQTLDSKIYSNSSKAYEEFVYALDKANFMKGDELKDEKNDTRGICATGKVYQFEVLQNNSTVKQLWTSTCKGSPGSFKGSVSQIESLFLKQIPDNKSLLDKIDLGSNPLSLM
jgi:hypothetical protein